MFEGFYTVMFRTPTGIGGGTATLREGRISGGDSTHLYLGNYTVLEEAFSASIAVTTHLHLPHAISVFGKGNLTLDAQGKSRGADMLVGTAVSPKAPDVTMHFIMKRISA